MSPTSTSDRSGPHTGGLLLAGILLLYLAGSLVGIRWGLPSRDVDTYLFGDNEPWTGERIARLTRTAEKTSDTRGADVDADPLARTGDPIALTDSEEKVAAIYLRYRLYTHQPDEMITLMALSQMNPGEWDFDPRMYQYGGLFIYPVGAVIATCGKLGLIDVRGDPVYYLDHPDAFGRFYVAARAYVAAWGLVGVIVAYLIARRLQDRRAGLLAALLFAVLPVVVCMGHEAKPHLPGAVLMMLAVLLAMRYAAGGRRRDWLGLCIACGAALGMVLSSLPVFVLIPLAELVRLYRDDAIPGPAIGRAMLGVVLGGATYALTNPYVPINLLVNREVLASNFGNSLAMYQIDRLGQGLTRMLELTIEGAGLPVVIVGVLALAEVARRKFWDAAPLAALTALFFVQFVLIGAGKPAEYGRFGIFINAALAIAAGCGLARRWTPRVPWINWAAAGLSIAWVGWLGGTYLVNFSADASGEHTRWAAADGMRAEPGSVAVVAEPVPYCFPPVNFAERSVWLFPSRQRWIEGFRSADASGDGAYPRLLVTMEDKVPSGRTPVSLPQRWATLGHSTWVLDYRPPVQSPISWANKPVAVQHELQPEGPGE